MNLTNTQIALIGLTLIAIMFLLTDCAKKDNEKWIEVYKTQQLAK
jgi:hypothetical protein